MSPMRHCNEAALWSCRLVGLFRDPLPRPAPCPVAVLYVLGTASRAPMRSSAGSPPPPRIAKCCQNPLVGSEEEARSATFSSRLALPKTEDAAQVAVE
eukprot:550217-Pyramimonas_sp.AAC.1